MDRPVTNISRRKFLATLGAGAAGALLARSAFTGAAAEASASSCHKHLAWVWQFDDDGPLDVIRSVLSQHNMGVILKTHDGTSWMSRWDKSPDAIRGPADVTRIANYFDSNGIPFHAWCVVQGHDPRGEAQMCAEVIAAGARSIVLDLEPNDGGHYWQGSGGDALTLGQELRRLAPGAGISVAPDPRPWQVDAVPMAEFASFCDTIQPQTYWDTFNSSANYRLLRQHGHEVGPEGVTPELILDVSVRKLGIYGKAIRPIGQGAANPESWRRFVQHAGSWGMDHVSVWRYGTAGGGVWPVLRDLSPPAAAPSPPTTAAVAIEPAPVVASTAVAAAGFPAYRLAGQFAAKRSSAPESSKTDEDKTRPVDKQNEDSKDDDRKDSASRPRVKETGLFGTKGIANRTRNLNKGDK